MMGALLAEATTSTRAPLFCFVTPLLFAPRSRLSLQALDDDTAWRGEEDRALIDATPAFTVGAGNTAATFWTALASSSAVLCQRSPIECIQRAKVLALEQVSFSYGREPKVLDSWQRLPGGRITGRLDSRTVWLTVEVEGRLASDPRSEPGYIETLGGRVYELGEPAASSSSSTLEATSRAGDELERLSFFKGGVRGFPTSEAQAKAQSPMQEILAAAVVPFGRAPLGDDALKLLLSIAIIGSLCFELGASGMLSEADRPPPLAASSRAAVPTPSTTPTTTTTTTRSYPAAERRVALTVFDQKARQALRVSADQKRLDALRNEAQSYEPGGIKSYDTRLAVLQKRLETDQARVGVDPEVIARDKDAVDNFRPRMQREVDSVRREISNMELRLRIDEEGLVELTRVEAERGPGANAVQLGVFPSSAVDPVTARTIPSVLIPSR